MASFRDFKARVPHLIRPVGGLKSEIFDLREDLKDWSDTLVSSEHVDLYVNPGTGLDRNTGTSPNKALATVAAAVAKLPTHLDHNVVIHLANGNHNWTRPITSQGTGIVALVGDGAGVVGQDGFTELAASAQVQSGSTTSQLVTVGGLTTNQYLGKTIVMLTGAAAGDRRQIRNNSTTTLFPSANFTAAPVAGDLFRVVEPAVNLYLPPTIFATPQYEDTVPLCFNMGGAQDNVLTGGALFTPNSRACFVSLRIRPTTITGAGFASVAVAGSSVSFYGVEILAETNGFVAVCSDRTSLMSCGGESSSRNFVAFTLGLAPSITAWRGWGVFSRSNGNSPNWQLVSAFRGYLCADHNITVTGNPTGWRLLGGGIVVANNPALTVDSGAKVFAGAAGTTDQKLLLRSEHNNATSSTLLCRGGGELQVGNAVMEKSNVGHCVLAVGANSTNQIPGKIGLGNGNTITGENSATFAVAVYNGGEVNFRSGNTFTGWTAGQQLAVRRGTISTSAGTTVQDEDASFLTTVGDALPSSGTADQRYGLIRLV